MLHKLNLENILFLDIETVPQYRYYNDLDEETKLLWDEKTKYLRKEEPAEGFYRKAGIWSEFGKIICISIGYFSTNTTNREFRILSFNEKEEEPLLISFSKFLNTNFSKPQHLLCAHNGKEFDFPYIARRMLINNIPLPAKLDLFGKKPWEVQHLDTLELWKFGDYKHYTSLKLLTHVLNIPSPKEDIDGSMVRDVYYGEQELQRIVKYCEKDVVAIAQIILKLRQEPLLTGSEIISEI